MRIVSVVWFTVITVLSLAPLSLKHRLGATGILHVWGHLVVFFTTAVVLCRRTTGYHARLQRCAATMLYGVVLEGMQTAIYRNRFEYYDVLTDTVAVILGFSVAEFMAV